MAKEVKFKGRIIRDIYISEDFKSYAVDVSKEDYPFINFTKYGNCSINGNIHSLTVGEEYDFTCIEQNNQYGYSYKVINIRKDKPRTEEDVYQFLREFLTLNQASELYRYYPNIIDLVLNNQCDKVDLSKLHGIGEFTFGKIKQKILDNYMLFDIVAEYGGILNISVIKKLYDKYPSIEKIRSEMKKRPYSCLTNISGIGFKKADQILLDMEKNKVVEFETDLKTSEQRCYAACIYLLQDNELNGNTCIDLVELRNQVMKLVPACANHFVDALKYDTIFYDKNKMKVALTNTYETELYIAEQIKDRLKIKNTWDFNIDKYTSINGTPLSDEQIEFLSTIIKNQLVVLSAPGGTGKSFSTKAVINMFEDNKITYKLCSPTGKASKKLSEYTERPASTIHRLLCYKNGKFMHDEQNPIIADAIIVDEVGMTDIKLFASLLKAIPKNTKIILIGDHAQLNSVGAGCLLRDLIECKYIPQVHYTHVYRLGEGGALTACTYVRQNKTFLTENKLTQLGTDKSYSFIPVSKEKMNNAILQLYKKLLNTWERKDITVISSYNVGDNGCDALNKILQPIANPLSIKQDTPNVKVKQDKSDVTFYVGDSVIQNVNNYSAELYVEEKEEPWDIDNKENEKEFIPNGTQGTIVKIEDNNIIIDFDGVLVKYKYNDMSSVRHSFALSVHKLQGSQNKVIIFCCPSSHIYMLNNNLIYTALSRAEKVVYHLSDIKTIKIAMNKSDNKKRISWLGDLLKETPQTN